MGLEIRSVIVCVYVASWGRRGSDLDWNSKRRETMCQEISCLFLNDSFRSSVHGSQMNVWMRTYTCVYTYFEVERPQKLSDVKASLTQKWVHIGSNLHADTRCKNVCKGQEGFWLWLVLSHIMSCPLLSFFQPFSFSLVPVIYIQLLSQSVFVVGAYAVWYSCVWPQDKYLLCSPI